MSFLPDYAELFCLTNFSFLQGASHAEELAERAVKLGYSALAITDECSLAGVVRAHGVAKKNGLPLLVGAHFHLTQHDGRPAGYTEADLPGHLGAEVPDDGDGEALPGINAGEVLEGEGHVTAALAELKKLVAGAGPGADAGAGANDDADANAAPVEG